MHIYGPDGEHQGSLSEYSPQQLWMHGVMAELLILGGLLWAAVAFLPGYIEKAWRYLQGWQALAWPEQPVAAYYYYLVGAPLHASVDVVAWLSRVQFTAYPNLNTLIGVGCIVALTAIAVAIVTGLRAAARRRGVRRPFTLLLGTPALLLLCWYAGVWLFELAVALSAWLFATA